MEPCWLCMAVSSVRCMRDTWGVGLSGAGARLVYIVDAPCRSVGVPPCGEWRRRSCAQRLERMGVRMSRAVWMGLGALGMSTLPPDGRLRASAAEARTDRVPSICRTSGGGRSGRGASGVGRAGGCSVCSPHAGRPACGVPIWLRARSVAGFRIFCDLYAPKYPFL